MALLYAENGERFAFDDEMNSPTWSSPLTVTAYPIPGVAPVTTHVQKEQESLSTRLRVNGARSTIIPSVSTSTAENERDKFAEAVAFIRRHREDKFTLVSDVYGTVENLVLTDITWSYDNIDRVDFNIQAVVVRTAFEEFVAVPAVRKKKKTLEKGKDKGDKTPKKQGDDVALRLITPSERGNQAIGKFLRTDAPIRSGSSLDIAQNQGALLKLFPALKNQKLPGPVRNINTTRPSKITDLYNAPVPRPPSVPLY